MAGRLFDDGGKYILGVAFNGVSAETNFKVMLFTSPSTLTADNNTLVEAAGGGYARQTVDATDVDVTTTSAIPGGIPIAQWLDKTFVFTTGALTGNPTIYGYALLKGTAGSPHSVTDVIFAEEISPSVTPLNPNDEISIQMNFRLGNGNPT